MKATSALEVFFFSCHLVMIRLLKTIGILLIISGVTLLAFVIVGLFIYLINTFGAWAGIPLLFCVLGALVYSSLEEIL